MARFDEHGLPEDLREVQARLREARPTLSPLELDELKRRVMASSSQPKPSVLDRVRGAPLRARVLTIAVTALLLGGTAAGGIAIGGGGGNASKAQYKPGNGCGDKNHTHTGPPGNPANHHCPH